LSLRGRDNLGHSKKAMMKTSQMGKNRKSKPTLKIDFCSISSITKADCLDFGIENIIQLNDIFVASSLVQICFLNSKQPQLRRCAR